MGSGMMSKFVFLHLHGRGYVLPMLTPQMHGFQCALLNDSDSSDPLKGVANINFEHMGTRCNRIGTQR